MCGDLQLISLQIKQALEDIWNLQAPGKKILILRGICPKYFSQEGITRALPCQIIGFNISKFRLNCLILPGLQKRVQAATKISPRNLVNSSLSQDQPSKARLNNRAQCGEARRGEAQRQRSPSHSGLLQAKPLFTAGKGFHVLQWMMETFTNDFSSWVTSSPPRQNKYKSQELCHCLMNLILYIKINELSKYSQLFWKHQREGL